MDKVTKIVTQIQQNQAMPWKSGVFAGFFFFFYFTILYWFCYMYFLMKFSEGYVGKSNLF